MEDAIRGAALAAIFEKLSGLIGERHSIKRQISELNRRDLQIDQELADCAAGARVFGATPGEIEDQIEAAAERADAQSLIVDMTAQSAPLSQQQVTMPKIKDLVLDRLKAAGPAGTKAAMIREWIDIMYGSTDNQIHEKTVGMSLYRLMKQGLAHRRGITWIFGPDPSGKKNPGGETPGPVEDVEFI